MPGNRLVCKRFRLMMHVSVCSRRVKPLVLDVAPCAWHYVSRRTAVCQQAACSDADIRPLRTTPCTLQVAMAKNRPPLPPVDPVNCPHELVTLLDDCFSFNPRERPS